MAKQVKLTAQSRTGLGRSAVTQNQASRASSPPSSTARSSRPLHLQLSAREIDNVLAHATGEHFLVELEIAGGASRNRLALIQEVQHHPVRGDVLHVDFHAVAADEKLHAADADRDDRRSRPA